MRERVVDNLLNSNKLILASQSNIRQSILKNAGIIFDVLPSSIDEEILKKQHDDKNISDLVMILAKAKAKAVNDLHQNFYVIGCDQILSHDSNILHKSKNKDQLRHKLLTLRGDKHYLINAICLYHEQKLVWNFSNKIMVKIRDFSNDFLEYYLEHYGDMVLESVGGYQLENYGAQIIDYIDGDYFSVLGLPLFALMPVLRDYNVLGK